MRKRNPLAVVALTLVTFGIYAYYWLYKTTDELREKTGREDLHPAVDVLLALITVGLWGIWAGYRNARIVHEELTDRGEEHSDRSLAVAGISALSLVSGWAWVVAMAVLQEDLNRFAEAEVDHFAEAEPYQAELEELERELSGRPPVQARVELDPIDSPLQESRWDKVPSAPVFRSTAPMPVVR